MIIATLSFSRLLCVKHLIYFISLYPSNNDERILLLFSRYRQNWQLKFRYIIGCPHTIWSFLLPSQGMRIWEERDFRIWFTISLHTRGLILAITQLVLVAQSCLILCNTMDRSLPGSSVYGIFQLRIVGWVPIPFYRGSPWPRDQT